VLEKRVVGGQSIKTDGLPAFNVAKEIGHEHIPIVVYPKKGEPNYDASSGSTSWSPTQRRLFSARTMGSWKSIFRNTSMNSAYRFNRRFWLEGFRSPLAGLLQYHPSHLCGVKGCHVPN
jgi:hypothetical protein